MSKGQEDKLKERFDEIEREIMKGQHTAASVFTQMRTAAMYIKQAPAEQEPVGQWSDDEGLSWCDGSPHELASARESGWLTRTLYTAPAQPDTGMVAVPRELLERVIDVHDTGFDPDGVIMELAPFLEKAND